MQGNDGVSGDGSDSDGQLTPDVLLVGCVKGKLEWAKPVQARDLYASPLWRSRRKYAEQYAEVAGRPWYILSAKHGLLEPDTRIGWYNLDLGDLPAAERRAWSQRVVDALLERFPAMDGKVIEIHAGKDYVDFGLATGLQKAGAVVQRPLLGIPIGKHLGWYKEHGVEEED